MLRLPGQVRESKVENEQMNQTNNRYTSLLLCCFAVALLHLPVMAQPSSGRFGFRGLHLGMSRMQIDSLLDATQWRVMYPTAATVDGHTNPDVLGELLHAEPGSDISRIGCDLSSGNGDCLDFENALFMLENGEVASIIVTTPEILPPREKSLQTGLAILARAIAAEYGAPTKDPKEIPVPDLRAIPAGDSRIIAQWRHPARASEQIEVRVQRSRRKGYYISVVIMG